MRTLILAFATFISFAAMASEKVKIEVGLGYSVCYPLPTGCAYTLEPEVYEFDLQAQPGDPDFLTGKRTFAFDLIHDRKFMAEVAISKIVPAELPPQYSVKFKFWDVKHPKKKIEGIATTEHSLDNLDIVTIYGTKIKTAEFEMRPEFYLRSAAQ